MDEDKKTKSWAEIADLPAGLRELVDPPVGEKRGGAALLPPSGQKKQELLLPGHSSQQEVQQAQRPRTQKEQELSLLIAKRQEIIGKLKGINPLVANARKKIAEMVPAIRGTGASHTLRLAEEAERIEFSIATEADTPKKEKDLLKRLRGIKSELAKHKEIDDARKAVDAGRRELHSRLAEVKALEHELMDARAKCDAVYAQVLDERKAAYEHRERNREQRRQKQYADLKERVRQERRRQYDDEIKPYLKDYDDTVSMDEIVQIEKKEKKEETKEE